MAVKNVSNQNYNVVYDKQLETNIRKNTENIGFFDDEWSGEIFRKMNLNSVADWLQDKDKVCTDGKDDGKLSFFEKCKAFGKGFLGGIIKTAINHPLATLISIGIGAAAVALTGGAILPVLGAIGLTVGLGTTACGIYRYATADNDGDAKSALETAGTGVMSTILVMVSSGSILDKAANAGVKSAQVAKDANVFVKSTQMFKAVPESLKVSKNNCMNKLNIPAFGETTASSRISANASSFNKQKMYQHVVNKDFEPLADKSDSSIKSILRKFAKDNGLIFKSEDGSFVVKDQSGKVIREVHRGAFDGRWYDHIHAFDEKGRMTNRFVLNEQGKWQSTVEFLYDDAGKPLMSYGYGGKAGSNIVVQNRSGFSRTEMTLDEFVDRFGFIPEYYKEINP